MKTKAMLTEMLYRAGVEKTALKAEITALKMVHVSDRKKIAGLEEGREPEIMWKYEGDNHLYDEQSEMPKLAKPHGTLQKVEVRVIE